MTGIIVTKARNIVEEAERATGGKLRDEFLFQVEQAGMLTAQRGVMASVQKIVAVSLWH